MTVDLLTVALTVVSFVALFLVLHFLLFKPVLKLIHDRQSKIDEGNKLKLKSAEMLEEQNRFISARIEEETKKAREDYAKRVVSAEEEIAKARKQIQKSESLRLEGVKKDIVAEKEKMEKELESQLSRFAKTLADRLVSGDY
jgi:F-type H+-transporting ATPase subunit b